MFRRRRDNGNVFRINDIHLIKYNQYPKPSIGDSRPKSSRRFLSSLRPKEYEYEFEGDPSVLVKPEDNSFMFTNDRYPQDVFINTDHPTWKEPVYGPEYFEREMPINFEHEQLHSSVLGVADDDEASAKLDNPGISAITTSGDLEHYSRLLGSDDPKEVFPFAVADEAIFDEPLTDEELHV